MKKLSVCENSSYNFQNELDKLCIHHDMAYRDFKDLPRRTTLHDKAFNIAKNSKYNGYQRGLIRWFIIF